MGVFRKIMEALRNLVKNKKVCMIGSIPPSGISLDDYDYVVRLNEHWAIDMGRIDIWFYICTPYKVVPGWYFDQPSFKPKLMCLYDDGTCFKQISKVAEIREIPIVTHNHGSPWMANMREWFESRRGSPSTGMSAAYMLAQCQPKELLFTGMDLYSKETNHRGWGYHLPHEQAFWFGMMQEFCSFVEIGKDLQAGIEYWQNRDENLMNEILKELENESIST